MHRQNILFLLVVAAFMSVPFQAQAQQPAQQPARQPGLQPAQPGFESEKDTLPLTTSTSAAMYFPKPLTYPQQVARYEAEQRMLRMERNRWIGFDPARPTTNSSYTYSGLYNFNPGNNYSVAYGSRHRFYGW